MALDTGEMIFICIATILICAAMLAYYGNQSDDDMHRMELIGGFVMIILLFCFVSLYLLYKMFWKKKL